MGVSDDGLISTGVSGPIDMQFGELTSFRIADFDFGTQTISFTDLSAVHKIYKALGGKNILGLLGGDIMSEHQAIIDYPNQLLIMEVD